MIHCAAAENAAAEFGCVENPPVGMTPKAFATAS